MPKKAKQEMVPNEVEVLEETPEVEDIGSFAQRINKEMIEKFGDEFRAVFIKKDTTLFDALTRNINSGY